MASSLLMLLRKKGGAVTPPAFSPSDISGLAAWYDASDTSTITQAAGLVSQWNDKSSNANHATQVTGALQPTTGASTINGLNVITSNATSMMYLTADISHTTGYTVLFVGAFNDTSLTKAVLGGSASGGFCIRATAAEYLDVIRDNEAILLHSGTLAGTSNNIMICTTSSGGNEIFKNGVSVGSNTTDAAYKTGTNKLFSESALNSKFSGAAGELIIYRGIKNSSELNQLGNYAAAKWGIAWMDI